MQVFMTRRDALQCVHEPFGDAFYFGPERLGERYMNDAAGREASGSSDKTYQDIYSFIEDAGKKEVRSLLVPGSSPSLALPFFDALMMICNVLSSSGDILWARLTRSQVRIGVGCLLRELLLVSSTLPSLPCPLFSWTTYLAISVKHLTSPSMGDGEPGEPSQNSQPTIL
jgi:hypothetical protein